MTCRKVISVILSLVIAFSIIAIPASADEIDTITVHYYNENNWSNPYIYYYYGGNTSDSWPGNAMSLEGDGWYSYTIYNYSTAYVIFSDNGSNQNPTQNEQGFQVSDEMWYYKGSWCTERPENLYTIVHYYNENNWSTPYIYYYTDNNNPVSWPGNAMVSEGGNWYTYTIPDLTNPKVIFSNNGSNQNPDQNSPGFDVTGEKWYLNGTFYDSEPEGITVHYQNYDNWDNVNIYYYNGEKTVSDWTGFPMIADGDGWFTYKIYGFDSVKVLFNNGGNIQIPGQFEPGFDVSGEMWYRNGEWTTDRPDEITVYFYKPDDWDTPNIYYYKNDNDTGSVWPGEQMKSEGDNWYKFTITKYDSAKVIFNSGNSQIPAQNQPGFDVVGVMWYKDGVWYNEVPKGRKEPLENIGEVYYKEPSADDIVIDEETGYQYVKNQLLISAFMGVDKTVIEDIAQEIGANIVGYIELTNDYQFEFSDDKTLEELSIIAEYIDSFSFISAVTLNMASERYSEIVTTNDAIYNDGATCERVYDGKTDFNTSKPDIWDDSVPDGDNWGLEALNVLAAWEHEDSFSDVKVGIYDGMFGLHEDLIYDDIVNNPETIESGHGTHVAGILAAQHNNRTGISGVATNTHLYAYATNGSNIESSMGDKHAYATLIGSHVKVINVSMGMGTVVQYAASHGNTAAQNYITEKANVLSEFLNKLVVAGYDFLIVTSAGNTENDEFVADSSQVYGYRQAESTDPSTSIVSGDVQAFYDCELTAITDPAIKDRIIVVGAIGHSVSGETTSYNYTNFSNIDRGDSKNRVDVAAPGKDIISCVPNSVDPSNYHLMNGTSMASPYIAGIAAMMYQANPYLKAIQVKKYICESGSRYVSDAHTISIPGTSFTIPRMSYVIPDASVCYDLAVNDPDGSNNDLKLPSGILTGSVKNDDIPYSNVRITALRNGTGEYNLDDYCFSFGIDSEGYFTEVLPQGNYDLIVSADGYLPFCKENVVINPDETTYIGNLTLSTWSEGTFESAIVEGKVIDAINGNPVENATVKFRKGWDRTSGSYVKNLFGIVKSTTTNSNGIFSISLNNGAYTAEISKDGYVTGYYNLITDVSSSTNPIVTMVLSPVLSDDEYRIVLTWGSTPRDLDSHLTYYVNDDQEFHVYYSNRVGTYEGEEVASLDYDDINGYGPETITMTLKSEYTENGIFKYSVHNFSDGSSPSSTALSLSNAVVRVYRGNSLLRTFNVPINNTGTVWHVFDITGNEIVARNLFYSSSATGVK